MVQSQGATGLALNSNVAESSIHMFYTQCDSDATSCHIRDRWTHAPTSLWWLHSAANGPHAPTLQLRYSHLSGSLSGPSMALPESVS